MAMDRATARRVIAPAFVAALMTLAACADKGTTATATGPDGPATVAEVEGTLHVCSSCHGIDGASVSPTFPRLAAQRAEYLEVQLKAFRDHTRADPHAHTYMWGMAGHLSDSLIHGIATYYASRPAIPGVPGDPAEMAAGAKIFAEGLPARDVPACQGCHGEKAEGQETIPRLAGQHRGYLIEQLGHFATNARENEVMHANAKPLTADEIQAVTAWLAAR